MQLIHLIPVPLKVLDCSPILTEKTIVSISSNKDGQQHPTKTACVFLSISSIGQIVKMFLFWFVSLTIHNTIRSLLPVTVGKVESRGVAEAGLVESKLAGAAIEEYRSKMFGAFF